MSSSDQIDTFLIDIGNVLVTFDFSIAGRSFQSQGKVPDGRDPIEILLPLRDRLEVGELDTITFAEEGSEALGFGGDLEEFCQIYQEIFSRIPAMWSMIHKIKSRGDHRLLILSNTSSLHHEGLVRDFPIFECFEGGTYSYSAGSAKPDPKIYQVAIEELDLVPEETIYIDDLEANILAGESFGFVSHQYDLADHASCEEFVAEQGVELD